MKFFVTGGTGFIGSHFIQQALAAGHEVLALRRSEQSAPRLALSKNVIWLTKALDEVTVNDLSAVDAVVHLASPGVSPQKATLEELLYWNVTVLSRLITVASQADISRIVVAGTFAEYGRSADSFDPIPPHAPLLPTYDYAASKAAGFGVIYSQAISLSLELVYLRIFSAFGEGQHPSNFWPALMAAAKSGEDFEMTAGEQVRDYLPVEDVAKTFLNWSVSREVSKGNPVVKNVGSGKPISMSEFAEHWWKKSSACGTLKIGALPYRPNEIMRFVPEV